MTSPISSVAPPLSAVAPPLGNQQTCRPRPQRRAPLQKRTGERLSTSASTVEMQQ